MLNGKVYHTVRRNDVGGDWPFKKDHFILLNLAVGGNWPGNPDGNTRFP